MSDIWSTFAAVLPKCDPEVQRAVGELWGSALRRMKVAAREQCINAVSAAENADVSAWVFVSACKVGDSLAIKPLC